MRTIRLISLMVISVIALGAQTAKGFDLPDTDPWYYQSTSDGYSFWVPDKAQHYYGSVLLSNMLDELEIPAREVTAPLLAISVGFLWEVYQEGQGAGFSNRDLIADALGVATANLSSRSLRMWVDYSVADETITFNIAKFVG